MGAFGWPETVALLTSVGFGVVSAVLPVANAEAYIIASQVSTVAGALPIAIGVSIGQTIGKVLLFLGVRRGKEFRFFKHRERAPRPAGAFRTKLRAVIMMLLDLVGHHRWGLPIAFVAAVIGIPPLFAVALLAGATQMKVGWFALVVLAGRLLRFVLVVEGVHVFHP